MQAGRPPIRESGLAQVLALLHENVEGSGKETQELATAADGRLPPMAAITPCMNYGKIALTRGDYCAECSAVFKGDVGAHTGDAYSP